MTYELFAQEGFSTHIVMENGASDAFSFDYTGKSVRECGTYEKKMIWISQNRKIPTSKLIKSLRSVEHETRISDIQTLKKLKKPKIATFLKEIADECRQAISNDVTMNLAHAKYSANIKLVGTKHSYTKKHEHICALIEDKKNLDVVYVLNISKSSLNELPRMIMQAMNWIAAQRRLTKQKPDGVFPVVFSKEACGTLFHEIIGHQFELSASHSIYSPSKYPVGYQLLSDKLTVYDKPFKLAIPHDVDDEGTKCGQTKLLERGCIVSPMTDKRSFTMFPEYGLTGNARRESFLHYPASRFYRICVDKGTSTLSQAVNDMEFGIYIDHISAARCYYFEDRVTLMASRAYAIRRGVVTDEPMSCIVDDKISSFFFPKHVCDTVGTSPGFCNSSAGYMYVEHEAPAMSFESIKVKDVFAT